MNESKYKILWDYGGYEGLKFHDVEFDSIDAAVKMATEQSYSTRWLIVKIIEWEAKEI